MPTRKRRRRREKLQRHEYEYVVETEEGEEVVESLRALDPADQGAPGATPNGKRSGAKPKARADRGPVDRRGRPIPEPSLRRALKRAAIFMPFFVLFFFIAAPSLTFNQKLFQAVFLAALFIPASYLADRLVYRIAQRRAQAGANAPRR